jgi:hypothetical protein
LADGKLAGDEATPDQPTGERIGVGKGKRPITGADEALRHKRTRQVIETAMRQNGPPLVVVTHHAPHPSCLPAAHRTGWLAVKVREYAAIPSIRRYVIVDSNFVGLTVLERNHADDPWTHSVLTGDETLRIPEIGVELPVAEIYRRAVFPDEKSVSA